jgi:hypothetical protein
MDQETDRLRIGRRSSGWKQHFRRHGQKWLLGGAATESVVVAARLITAIYYTWRFYWLRKVEIPHKPA